MASIAQRVQRGVTLLNQRCPGWQNRINVDDLNLASSSCCVLGQVYGDYLTGCLHLNLAQPDSGQKVSAASFGFVTRGDYDRLTHVWRTTCSTIWISLNAEQAAKAEARRIKRAAQARTRRLKAKAEREEFQRLIEEQAARVETETPVA